MQLLDSNEDGNLVTVEILTSLLLLARGPAQRRIWLAFDLLDTSNDGFISQREVASFLHALGHVAMVRTVCLTSPPPSSAAFPCSCLCLFLFYWFFIVGAGCGERCRGVRG